MLQRCPLIYWIPYNQDLYKTLKYDTMRHYKKSRLLVCDNQPCH